MISFETKDTKSPAIKKFEADQFLVDFESYEFSNIDEAKRSPLAQKLFYLPFVKKVYIAQNFVAIEKYDIVEWQDVEQEIIDQLTEMINKDVAVVQESAKKPAAITVYAESTPNPSTMKFVANKKLVLGTYDFQDIDEAKYSPLAQELFKLPFVKAVFIDENYLSIQKYDITDWESITTEVREMIKKHLENEKVVVNEEQAASTTTSTQQEAVGTSKASVDFDQLDDTSQKIASILDEYVKPAVASDGGNIVFQSYDKDSQEVRVILQGACSGCPSSTMTLKNGIETMLKDMLPNQIGSVTALNG
jgi:Fe-S cluster biogenesis protein NfuA